MTLAEVYPDEAAKTLLDGLKIQTSKTKFVDVKVYGQSEVPNIKPGDAYVALTTNGYVESVTQPMGMYKGNLMVIVSIKCYTNGTANTKQMKQLIAQIQERCDRKVSNGFFFEFTAYSTIMPTTTSTTTGYATTILNLSWHTTTM